MDIPVKALKLILTNISKGEITDADYFINYNTTVYPEIRIMVDVDWDKLPKEFAHNYNQYLKDKYEDIVRTFIRSINIKFNGRIYFEILNWGGED